MPSISLDLDPIHAWGMLWSSVLEVCSTSQKWECELSGDSQADPDWLEQGILCPSPLLIGGTFAFCCSNKISEAG